LFHPESSLALWQLPFANDAADFLPVLDSLLIVRIIEVVAW
jgi:hypothetical protein